MGGTRVVKYAAALLLAACALGSIPPGNPSICSKPNVMPHRVDVFLQDNENHVQWVGWIEAGGHICAEWTLPGSRGRWGFGDNYGPVRWERHWFHSWTIRGRSP